MEPASLILGGYQLLSGLQQAQTLEAQFALQKQIREYNKEFLDIDIYNANRASAAEINRYQNNVIAIEAAQKAAFAVNDVDSGFGSARVQVQESKTNAFLNTIDLKAAARARALNLENQKLNLDLGGQMRDIETRLSVDSRRNAAIIGGAATIAGGYNLGNSSNTNVDSDSYGTANPPRAI